MPIDPRLPLTVQAPRFSSPLDDYAKFMSLKDLVDQRRYREMQVRQLELKAQQEQREEEERQAFKDALARGAKPEELIATNPELGIRYNTNLATMQTQQRLAKTAELTQQAEREKLDQSAKERALSELDSIRSVTDQETKDRMFMDWQAKNPVLGRGVQWPMSDKGFEFAGKRVLGPDKWRTYSAGLAQETRSQSAEARAQSQEADRALAAVQEREQRRQTLTGTQPVTQYQREQLAQSGRPNSPDEVIAALTDPKTPPEMKAALKERLAQMLQYHTQVRPAASGPVAGYGSQTSAATGEEFLKTLDPGIQKVVVGTVSGALALPPANSRAPGAQELRRAVLQYDPNFNEQRAQIRKAFTTGKEGQNIGAINTAVVHLGRLADTADALKNGSFTPGNEMYQYFKDKFGSATTTNFGLLKDAVAGEMAAALKGTATDIEIANMKQSIRASNSPEQMQGVVKEGMGILSDKAKTYDDRYHRDNPDDTSWSPILPTARESLTRFGVPYTGSARGAKTEPAPGRAYGKYAVNPKTGQRIGSDDGQTWYDVKTGKKL
jgi:hypothetical protein